jgi:hypothetical protein
MRKETQVSDTGDMGQGNRSYDRFQNEDFAYLYDLAVDDLDGFTDRNQHHSSLLDRVLLVTLCQGAALHFFDGRNGVKDFDVWTFFSHEEGLPVYPPRRRGLAEFTGERFQESERRVDLMGRTLKASVGSDAVDVVQEYLRGRLTKTAWCLAQKAVVVLSPDLRGKVIWPA